MAQDLIVPAGTTVVLDEKPPAEYAASLQRVKITTLRKLVKEKAIRSDAAAENLLKSAKKETKEALTRRETYTPYVTIPGTPREDLRRYAGFKAGAPKYSRLEHHTFWRTIRTIDPARANKNGS